MANDLNLCQFIGNLGADPEARYTKDGKAVANVRIAVNASWKNQSGEKQEETEWVSLVFFGKLAEIVQQYLKKGSKIYVSGRMKTRKWQDKDGQDRYSTEVVADNMQMLDGKREEGSAPRSNGGSHQRNQASSGFQAPKDFDDDIPF